MREVDFNKLFGKGIPYCHFEEEKRLEKWLNRSFEKSDALPIPPREQWTINAALNEVRVSNVESGRLPCV